MRRKEKKQLRNNLKNFENKKRRSNYGNNFKNYQFEVFFCWVAGGNR
jgi:hypothetical protein